MDKEKIEEFDKEQLELLLNDLQDFDKFTLFKDGAFRYELGKYQANLLVNCIKKQKEAIDKAIEYIEKLLKEEIEITDEESIYYGERFQRTGFADVEVNKIIDILKGGNNNER